MRSAAAPFVLWRWACVLPQREERASVRSATVRRTDDTLEETLLRVLRQHADEDGRVTATWAEIRIWVGPTPPGDIHAAAIHLADDGYFRNRYFEGSSDGVCSVVLR
jgi:hypothetical protein